jgi:acyl transferase domain-containing protein
VLRDLLLPGNCARERVSAWRLVLQAGMLAADGRCKSLDALADGYVRSESCGALLLGHATPPTPPRAQLVGCAAFHGSAVNQDGRSSSLTAPNGPSQQVTTRNPWRDVIDRDARCIRVARAHWKRKRG